MISLVDKRPSSSNFTKSDVLLQWTRATTVRLQLLRTKNPFGHLTAVDQQQDPNVLKHVSDVTTHN